MPRPRLAPLLFALALASGHAHGEPPRPAHAPDSDSCVPLGQWLDPASGRVIPLRDALERLARQQVVLLGEEHDNVQHHRWQLHTLIQLHTPQPRLALGLEAFPRRTQPAIDRWLAGELDEQAFLDAVQWRHIWNYDPEYYLPLLRFARMYRVPVYALNVDRKLIDRIGREGWNNIPADQREGIGDPAPASADYIEELQQIFGQHMHGGHGEEQTDPDSARLLKSQGFQRFLQSQLVWDRAMAEAARQALDDGAPLVVGIVGAGHLMGGYGIPHQLAALGVHKVHGLLPWDGAIPCEQLQPGLADLAFGLRPPEPRQKTPHPRLGIYLAADEQGVKIQRLVPGSIAERLGLQAGDRIVELAGLPVARIDDVIERVRRTAFGTWLPLVIERQGKRLEKLAKFPPRTPPADVDNPPRTVTK